MRKLTVLGTLLCLLGVAAACWGDTITSALGHQAPAFAPGMTPSKLGWGPDDNPYPHKYVVNPKDGSELAWVPPGEFMMGSTPEEQDYALRWGRKDLGESDARLHAAYLTNESPRHKVRITKGFWLGKYAVTNAQYRRFKPDHTSGDFDGLALEGLSLNGDKQPVVKVSWNDARHYCEWAATRLPTEAEWEYACRAGTQTKFWWGESETEAGKYANVADRTLKAKRPDQPIFDTDDGHTVNAPVGSYMPNDFGLYDMLGNVSQWCEDLYDALYYHRSPGEDPLASERWCTDRVLRGGAWFSTPDDCRSASRYECPPEGWSDSFGFRVARTP